MEENKSEKNINEASNKIIDKRLKKIYLSFMAIRFPAHSNFTAMSYAMEWVDRFNSGDPMGFMDQESLKSYKQAILDNQ